MFKANLYSIYFNYFQSPFMAKKNLKAVDKLVESQDYDTALEQLLAAQS